MVTLEDGYGGIMELETNGDKIEVSIEGDGRWNFFEADPVKLKEAVDALATDILLENKEKR